MTDVSAITVTAELLQGTSTEAGFSDNPASLLERVFEHILTERMQGLPVINSALRVEAVDFTEWEGHWLGVLITPWFINLMIIPKRGSPWPELEMGKGKELKINFPQGSYKFSARQEEGVGSYLNCSLASPVHEWKSQSDAVNTANDVMRLIKLIPLVSVEDKVENSAATSCNKSEKEPVDCHLTRRGFLGGGAVAG